MGRLALAVAVAAALVGCGRGGDGRGGVPGRYQLVCDSTDTRESSTLWCMRIDSRDGDVRRVDLGKLPQSNGPTRSASAGADGTYQLVCDSTDTELKSEFRCLRLHRDTGEILLINLPKAATYPE